MVGATVSIQATTPCCTGDYLAHDSSDDKVVITAVTSSSSSTTKADATWILVPGLAGSNWSFESDNYPNKYIRHYDYVAYIASDGGSNAWDTARTHIRLLMGISGGLKVCMISASAPTC